MIINMTPHAVCVVDSENTLVREYPASGQTIRLASGTETVGSLDDGTPLTKTVFGEPTGLPEYQANTFYIVSQLVKSALPQRADLLVPAEVVRDEKGVIIGCRSLGI